MFVGNLELILDKILGIFGGKIENFWENFRLVISEIFKIIY